MQRILMTSNITIVTQYRKKLMETSTKTFWKNESNVGLRSQKG